MYKFYPLHIGILALATNTNKLHIKDESSPYVWSNCHYNTYQQEWDLQLRDFRRQDQREWRVFSSHYSSHPVSNTYPTHIPHRPFSHPLITRCSPRVTGKIRRLSREESNLIPLVYRYPYHIMLSEWTIQCNGHPVHLRHKPCPNSPQACTNSKTQTTKKRAIPTRVFTITSSL